MNTILLSLIVCTVYGFVVYQIMNYKLHKKIDNKSFLRGVKEEISSLITQINETSDRNVQLLEHRLDKLNRTLDEADRKITLLRYELDRKIDIPLNEDTLLRDAHNIVKEQIQGLEPEIEPEVEVTIIKDEGSSLSKRERILLLHKQGISSSVIASQTKVTIGEVELIISLNRG
ncbi:MAG: hypothetical protein B6229_02705 [Spirochaetaceae bacterium 4572_7]|nr:MAG: hypothetical protein B6229_02705 [Spirochaetaceae bacterium 4572_7]